MITSILVLSMIGIVLSLYVFFVESRREEDEMYHAMCDLSDRVSCTKAFSSAYGKLFGFSNSLAGMVFYSAMVILVYFGQYTLAFYATLVSLAVTAYLFYALFFKVKTFCIVCAAIYIINILLFVVTLRL